MMKAIFQKKYFWNIFCLLCGVFIIGLFLFIGHKDSEATLGDILTGILFGAIICTFTIPSLFFNFKAYFYIEEDRIQSRYHFFGKINCNLSDAAFVLGRNNTLMIQLKNGKCHTIMGIENAWLLATAIREKTFHLETAAPDDILLKLEIAQAAHKKRLFYTLGSGALMFINILVAVLLTGGKEMSAFTQIDWTLFALMGVIEVLTVFFMFKFANQCGKCAFPIEQLKHQIKGAYVASTPLPAGIIKRIYTDANYSGRIVVCGYPNDESVYYCVQEFVGNLILKTVHTSKIYDDEEDLAENADFNTLIDITDHFI